MTTLVSDWITDTRYHLDGNRAEELNTLGASYTAAGTSLTITYAMGSIAPGAVLGVGLNVFKVMAVSGTTAGSTATVIPAFEGSTSANAASGAIVRVNPRFSDFRILRAINDHLYTLTSPVSGLYAIGTQDIEVTDSVEGYELTPATGLQRVLEVRRQLDDDLTSWVRVPASDWDLIKSAQADGFTTGYALRIKGICDDTIQVVYAKAFTAVSDTTANVSTSGIPSTAEDIPPLGAAIRLMAGREVARNATSAQSGSRRPSEVPPGAVAASYRGLAQLHAQRLQEESARLRSGYPTGR